MIFHPLYWVLPQIFDAKDVEVLVLLIVLAPPPPPLIYKVLRHFLKSKDVEVKTLIDRFSQVKAFFLLYQYFGYKHQ